MRPEFLGLNESAPRQLLPGNSHRESEIVLDARTRPRLAAGGVTLDHQHVQSLGRAVNGRGQPTGPSAHHDEIVHATFIDSGIQTEAHGGLRVTGIAKHQFAPADQHRNLGHPDFEMIQQSLNVGISFHVDIRERMAVAGKKPFQT